MAGLSVDEVQALFAEEAAVRLSGLGHLLLQLEQTGSDDALIRNIYRELHTLKGSAAIAGLTAISECAHQQEELVEQLRTGQRTVTPEVIDVLLAGADQLGALIAGTPATSGASAARDGADPGHVGVSTNGGAPNGAGPNGAGSNGAGPNGAASKGADACGIARVESSTAAEFRTASTLETAAGEVALRPPAVPTSHGAGGLIQVQTARLEELTRLVGESASAHLRIGQMLKDRFGVDPASCTEFNELSRSLNDLQERATRTQMVPIATVTEQLQRAVRDLSRAQGKDVRWEARGIETELDRGVLHQLSDSLMHLVRNAVDHGIEMPADRVRAGKPGHGTIRLHAMQLGPEVIIAVTDDGRGIDTAGVSETANRHGIDTTGLSDEDVFGLTFEAGLSTTAFVTDVSGRGVGLDVVRTNVEAARGRVEVRSEAGVGAEFRMIVPITLAVLRCLLVEADGQNFALPFHRVVLSQADDPSRRLSAEGRPVVWVDGQPVPFSVLGKVLGTSADEPVVGPIVVVADTSRRHAFQVDRLVGQRDVVLKGLSRLFPHLPAVAGASVNPDGSILVVLDPPGLIQRARQSRASSMLTTSPPRPDAPRRRILVVDDALTVRELQRNILERAGFDVRVAGDGAAALAKLVEAPSDLVLTDVEMPVMDGFALTEAIRAHPTLANVPIMILSSRSSESDRQRGLDAGADGYIIKSGFDEASLLSAVNRLLGAPR